MSEEISSTKKLRTQSAVAATLGISRQAVSRLIKNQDRTGIPTHEDRGGVYWIVEEITQWYKYDFNPGRGPKSGLRKLSTVD